MTVVAGTQARPMGFFVRTEAGESCRSLFDDRWDDLVRRQPLPNPTLSATWLHHLIEWENGRPVAIVVEQDGALVAAGAFGLYRPAGRVGPTFARWLGDYRQWFSPDILVDPEVPGAGEAVVDALLGLADVVHLPAAEHGAVRAALWAQIPWLTELPGAESWIAPLPPPRMEKALTRFEADCRRAARRGAEITMRLASTPDEVVVALERLFVLHAERWRMRGGEIPRFSTTEAHRAWYRRVIAAMAERGEALIAEVIEDGELFGAELALTAGRGGVLHTTAIRLGGKLDEPGRASKLKLIRALEEAGVQAVDLGCGACEPGSPKSAVGPTRVVVKRLLAADSRTSQHALDAVLGLRGLVRRSSP
ncbi:MAG: GNAT family N-acetyltransferase [Gaiellaceae bacterium]|jgi:CelD/BcsL family acetyltransferase involved in cellulose biosynthesis